VVEVNVSYNPVLGAVEGNTWYTFLLSSVLIASGTGSTRLPTSIRV